MKPARKLSRPSIPAYLLSVIAAEFDDPQPASRLFEEFLQQKSYSRSFASTLIDMARGNSTWEIRRLAALMLEHQVLKIAADDLDEFDFLFARLRLKAAPGANFKVDDSVLKEGFSTTDPRAFASELKRRLERLRRIHSRIHGRRTSSDALRDFIKLSRRDSKIYLARHLFDPEEIVDLVLEQVKVSSGLADMDLYQPAYTDAVSQRARSRLPDFEAKILDGLCSDRRIYWVSDRTNSEINSLVEYPLTTVVLVIKPPGSDIEFEIKRAGLRGPFPLGAVYRRDGYDVPAPHRIDGGSMQAFLRHEFQAASIMAGIYELAHGERAPIPSYYSRLSISNIPVGEDRVNVLDYFTDPRIFGARFDEVQKAMRESVDAFKRESGATLPDLPGSLGLAVLFVGQVAPCQAILSHTTSFRLTRLFVYLSADGAEKYFWEGLKVNYTDADAMRLADDLMEEILGVYSPPDVVYRSYEQYIAEAFAVKENRERADHNFISVLRQTGKFWGTMIAARGYSWGESFVTRNVGLRSVWEQGEWRVRIIFMDHDTLQFPGRREKNFYPHATLGGIRSDEEYVQGCWIRDKSLRHLPDCLEAIYRPDKEVSEQGRAAFQQVLKEAYTKTHDAMAGNEGFEDFLNKTFLERIRDWDEVVSLYMKKRKSKSWKTSARRLLSRKGYDEKMIERFVTAAEEYSTFLERYDFLYR
ncbi:MAG: hypothetical protein AB1631_34110, partial [Acidobacteriota bacterium]